jgi:hypothetical protein
MIEALYYECHVTIEPVQDERLTEFSNICSSYGFKVATLLMQKSLDRSNLDSFCTGKATNFAFLKARMDFLLSDLNKAKFNVYRYKIESILLDSKVDK